MKNKRKFTRTLLDALIIFIAIIGVAIIPAFIYDTLGEKATFGIVAALVLALSWVIACKSADE